MVRAGELPAQPKSATSVAAAKAKKPTAEADRERVFQFLVGRGDFGSTRDECSVELNMPVASVCARFWELEGGNAKNPHPVRIETNGKKRPTRSGKPAFVSVVKGRIKRIENQT